jgi:uncharacterized protein
MVSVDGETGLRISVAYSPRAGEVDVVDLQLAFGATVIEAIGASGLPQRHPTADLERLPVGIWGRLCERGDVLREGDRVELYRPLQVDPKEARRLRQRAQGPLKKR